MTRETTIISVSFHTAGIDDLSRRKQRNMREVARVLARVGRFSVFEATENQTIARTMDRLVRSGWFDFDESTGFPWTKVTLTEVGKDAIRDGQKKSGGKRPKTSAPRPSPAHSNTVPQARRPRT